MKELENMTREELKEYAKDKGIRLYTTVPEKMVAYIKQVEHVREIHGDAFRDKEALQRSHN